MKKTNDQDQLSIYKLNLGDYISSVTLKNDLEDIEKKILKEHKDMEKDDIIIYIGINEERCQIEFHFFKDTPKTSKEKNINPDKNSLYYL